MEAVEAVSSQMGSVWRQLGQCLLKWVQYGGSWGSILSKRFSMEAVGALSPFQIDVLYVLWR
jgi:hypothetical protein